MRHVYKIFLLLLSSFVAQAQVQQGSLKVIIANAEDEGVIGAQVAIYDGETLIKGGVTDPFGLVQIPGIDPGSYDVEISYVGYKTIRKENVIISSNNIRSIEVSMQVSVIEGTEVVIEIAREPLIKESFGGLDSRSTEEIGKLPVRGATGVIATTGGVQSIDGGDPVIRGGRSDQVITYIDGMPVRGNGGVPVSSYGEIQVYQSGIPAEFGDATSGVVNISTRRPANNFFNRLELITSEGLDAYGYNTVEFLSSGPLVKKVIDSTSGASIAKMGFLVGGTLNLRKDGDPSAIGIWKVDDDVLNDIKNNPLRPSAIGSGFVSRSAFLTEDDLSKVKVKPNVESLSYNFNAKLSWLVSDNIFVTVGGRARRFSGNDYRHEYTLLNFENNSEFRNETYAGYARLKQSFESSEGALIQNAGYTLQFDYTHFQNTRWDPGHQDNVFNYGHVGQFDVYQTDFQFEGRQINEGTPGAYNLFALYEQETPIDTAVRFTPGTANPTSANYTRQFFDFSNNDVGNVSEVLNGGALINGTTPQVLYSLWRDVGTPYNFYTKSSEDQASFNLSLNGKIKNHSLKMGIRYEQRVTRFYSSGATGLWNTMRQSVNRHIRFQSTNLDSAIYVFTDGNYYGYELDQAQGAFLDTVRFQRILNSDQQTSFDRNFRQFLIDNNYKDINGDPINEFTFINPDAYDPSTFQLSWFSADDLLQNQSVSYYGYDYLGNRLTGGNRPSLEDYLDDPEERKIAPYTPIYLAGYIQDEVVYKNLNLRLGLRVDRFDANQFVLKDQYSLYPIKTVSELSNTALSEHVAPGNIGGDYVVYVDDPYNPSRVVGYRNEGKWFMADGSETNDPALIAQQSRTGTIAPYTSFSSKAEENEIGLTTESFEDYQPQINLMPRVAVSFPISEQAMFFANYDVLTQRPASRNIATIDAYYYLPSRSTSAIGNPDLKPEKTISYEVGFQQTIGDNMAIKFNAFYKELRDMIQVTPIRYAYPIDYTTYGNIDFGTVKGFIFNYKLRPGGYSANKNVSLDANYTLMFANATGSGDRTQAALINAGQPNLRTLQPTNQDRRHNFVLTLDYRYGSGADYNGYITKGGKKIFENTGINFIASALSGRPYSGQANVTQAVAIGVQQRSTIDGTINGNRYPWIFNVDGRLNKTFPIALGKKTDETGKVTKEGKMIGVNVYVWARNLFNTRNIVSLYRYTGLPDDDGYLSSAEGQQATLLQDSPESYQQLYDIKAQDPRNYTRPRMIQLGAVINF